MSHVSCATTLTSAEEGVLVARLLALGERITQLRLCRQEPGAKRPDRSPIVRVRRSTPTRRSSPGNQAVPRVSLYSRCITERDHREMCGAPVSPNISAMGLRLAVVPHALRLCGSVRVAARCAPEPLQTCSPLTFPESVGVALRVWVVFGWPPRLSRRGRRR